ELDELGGGDLPSTDEPGLFERGRERQVHAGDATRWSVAGWRGPESNRRHHGFQPCALPTEPPRPDGSVYSRPRSPSGRTPTAWAALRPVHGQPLRFRAVEGGSKREVAIIGAALDLGQSRRGVDMGPSAIRYAGLEERLQSLGFAVRDHGNVETAVPEATSLRDERARFLPEIKATCERIAAKVVEEVGLGAIPLVLGGGPPVALR